MSQPVSPAGSEESSAATTPVSSSTTPTSAAQTSEAAIPPPPPSVPQLSAEEGAPSMAGASVLDRPKELDPSPLLELGSYQPAHPHYPPAYPNTMPETSSAASVVASTSAAPSGTAPDFMTAQLTGQQSASQAYPHSLSQQPTPQNGHHWTAEPAPMYAANGTHQAGFQYPPHQYAHQSRQPPFTPYDMGPPGSQTGPPAEEGNAADNPNSGSPDFPHTALYDPFPVKHRRRTTAPQLKILEAQFATNPKPDIPVRKSLAEELGMTPREVQVWFQNRRAKSKRLEKKAQQAAAVEGANLSGGSSVSSAVPTPTHDAPPPAVPEPPRMSERQRGEQQYFHALARAEQQSGGVAHPQGAMMPMAPPTVDMYGRKASYPSAMPPPDHSAMLNRRMTMPAVSSMSDYSNSTMPVPMASYQPAPMWHHPQASLPSQPHQQRFAHTASPHVADDQYRAVAGGPPQPPADYTGLHMPDNGSSQAYVMPPATAPMPPQMYGPYRSPATDVFSPTSQVDGVSPGVSDPSAGSYFPRPADMPPSTFAPPPAAGQDDMYFSANRRQHSSGSISSSNPDSSLNYDLNTGAMTPTSNFSFSTGATTPNEYLPSGFDPNSRRASCPAEFIASFDGMSMPQQFTGMPVPMGTPSTSSSHAAAYGLQPPFAPGPVGDVDSPMQMMNPSRRHSIAVGATAFGSAQEDPGSTFISPTSSSDHSRSPAYGTVAQRSSNPLDPIAEAPAPQVHQPRPMSAAPAPAPFLADTPEDDMLSSSDYAKQMTSQHGPQLLSPLKDDVASPASRKSQPMRKSRSSTSVRSIHHQGSSDKLNASFAGGDKE